MSTFFSPCVHLMRSPNTLVFIGLCIKSRNFLTCTSAKVFFFSVLEAPRLIINQGYQDPGAF